jgi:tRNA (guanosine-2'-O-)-methyltransferase
MVGVVESYNISMANALVLYHAFMDRTTRGTHGDMTEEEKKILTATFYLRHIQVDAQKSAHRSHGPGLRGD